MIDEVFFFYQNRSKNETVPRGLWVPKNYNFGKMFYFTPYCIDFSAFLNLFEIFHDLAINVCLFLKIPQRIYFKTIISFIIFQFSFVIFVL